MGVDSDRMLVIAGDVPEVGPFRSWPTFGARARELLAGKDLVVLTGHFVTPERRAPGAPSDCPTGVAYIAVEHLEQFKEPLSFDARPSVTYMGQRLPKRPKDAKSYLRWRVLLPFRHPALQEWADQEGHTLVVLFPVLTEDLGPVYGGGHLTVRIERFPAAALAEFSDGKARTFDLAPSYSAVLARELPEELWGRGLKSLLAPVLLDTGLAAGPQPRLFALTRNPKYPAQVGLMLAGTYRRAKVLIAATPTWTGGDTGMEGYMQTPLLDKARRLDLLRAADWFHQTPMHRLRVLADPTWRCPYCGGSTCALPGEGKWEIEPARKKKRKLWELIIPEVGTDVELPWQPGAALEILIDKAGGSVGPAAIVERVKLRTGHPPKTPLKKMLSLVRKLVCSKTDLCPAWMGNALDEEDGMYFFDPKAPKPSVRS